MSGRVSLITVLCCSAWLGQGAAITGCAAGSSIDEGQTAAIATTGATGSSGMGGVDGSGGQATSGMGGMGGMGDAGGMGGAGGEDPCAMGCAMGTWDLDNNPLTGECGCEYICEKLSDDDPIDPNYADDNCDGGDGGVEQC
ncbi:MAG: hypothetical protein VB934_22220, partial [Polyangiaceae bacterium]